MAKVKLGMTADRVLELLGKPSGKSVIEGEDDPTVIWPYGRRRIHFQKRERDGVLAWRVVKRAWS